MSNKNTNDSNNAQKKHHPDDRLFEQNSSSRLVSLLPGTGGGLIKKQPSSSSALHPPPQQQQRNYRRSADATPSHPGGVNREVQHRAHARHEERNKQRRQQHSNQQHNRDDTRDSSSSSSSSSSYYGPASSSAQSNEHDNNNNSESGGSRKRSRRHDYEDDSKMQPRAARRRDDDYNDEDYQEDGKRRQRSWREQQQQQQQQQRHHHDHNENQRAARRKQETGMMMPPPPRQQSQSHRPRDASDAPTPVHSRHISSSSFRHNNNNNNNPQSRPSSSRSRSRSTSTWDVETPAPLSRDDVDANLARPSTSNTQPPQQDDSFERQFYLQEDEGHYVLDGLDEDGNMGRFLFTNDKIKARQAQMEQQKQTQGPQAATMQRHNPRRSAMQDDQEAWEQNRLHRSGAMQQGTVDLNMTTEQDLRVTLLVHQVKPPFLQDGRVSFSTQQQPVPTVKDNTSDFAKMARNGSETLRMLRAQKDKHAMRQRFWELGGTRMGDAVGVKEPEQDSQEDDGDTTTKKSVVVKKEQEPEPDAGGEIDYKKSTNFAAHFKKQKQDGKDNGKQDAVSEFAKTKTIREQREFLPIFTVREELMNAIRESPVLVVVGETGSGKSTQLIQYCYEDGYGRDGLLACTQPRRVAAMSVSRRVCDEVTAAIKERNKPLTEKEELGGTVGYTIRFEDCTSEHTKIKFLTDGVLLRESLNDPDLNKYSVLLIDEAHERSLNTDVLFGVLRKVLTRRSDLKVIVTSATLSADVFSEYFGGAPVFRIPGRTFPVETYFSKSVQEDYVMAAVKQTLNIHFNRPPGDILIFMTGQEDIEGTCQVLAEKMEKIGVDAPPLLVLPMYSQLPADLQAKIFQAAPPGMRKCIVSTNVAETSLTVDGIRYVIDSGYFKLKVYNPKIGMDALLVTPISKANANQRSGRAGRTGPGFCYRLYTERQFREELLEATVPEIQRTNLSNVVLLLKSLGIRNMMEFSFMDPPPQEIVANSLYQLWVLGALDNQGDLTPTGRHMVEFPLDPSLSKMVLHAHEHEACSAEVLIVVSMLSVPSVFFRPKDREEESDAAREKFFVPESDHLTLLNVYLRAQQYRFDAAWCTRHFIHAKGIRKAREVHAQLLDLMKQQRMEPISVSGGSWDAVRRAICSAYFYNSSKIKGIGEYVNMLTGITSALHPSSALYGLGYTPDYVCYHELISTTKEYMSCVTAVEGEWLAEAGPMFFSIKESFETMLERRQKERSTQAVMEEEFEKRQKQKPEDSGRGTLSSATSTAARRSQQAVATPGRAASATPRFMPKKRGRLGL